MRTPSATPGQWFDLLEISREIAADGVFTSTQLADAGDISIKEAAAWLAKFYRWGYALRVGRTPTNGRWSYQWKLTRWGFEVEPKRSIRSRPAEKDRQLRVAANPKKKD